MKNLIKIFLVSIIISACSKDTQDIVIENEPCVNNIQEYVDEKYNEIITMEFSRANINEITNEIEAELSHECYYNPISQGDCDEKRYNFITTLQFWVKTTEEQEEKNKTKVQGIKSLIDLCLGFSQL